MAISLHADLLTAQTAGYPTGGYAPAVQCIFTSKDGNTTHDYSFDPTSNTNRLLHVEQTQEREGDPGVIRLKNNDRSVPADLTGYYVDIGWGLNTSSGLKYGVAPRMWVMQHHDISGGRKNGDKDLLTQFIMGGAWSAVLNVQPVRLGTTPYFQYTLASIGDPFYIIPALTGLTIYYVIEYLIQTGLSAQTGITFTLDALGDQDDGYIDALVPFPSTTDSDDLLRTINADSPGRFETYGELITALLDLTKCYLIPRAGLAFKIIFPQAGDTADETYYETSAKGHPFYEVENRRVGSGFDLPNHIEVFGTDPEVNVGDWFDSDHYSSPPSRPFTPADIDAAYTGDFMPVTRTISEDGLDTESEADDRASFLGRQLKDQILGTRVIIPMDARVELYDRVSVEDDR